MSTEQLRFVQKKAASGPPCGLSSGWRPGSQFLFSSQNRWAKSIYQQIDLFYLLVARLFLSTGRQICSICWQLDYFFLLVDKIFPSTLESGDFQRGFVSLKVEISRYFLKMFFGQCLLEPGNTTCTKPCIMMLFVLWVFFALTMRLAFHELTQERSLQNNYSRV